MDNEKVLSDSREEQLEIIRQLRPIDDDFMTKVFEDKACAEVLLSAILDRDDLKVERAVTQFEIKNLQGRSSVLDIYAIDDKGCHYNIEVQRVNKGAEPKRARYNSSLLDANLLMHGVAVSNLPEVYVIFITEHDYFGRKKPLYTVERTIREIGGDLFNDGSHIIYVNSEIQDATRLGRLMSDMHCADPHEMNNEVLSERIRYFKETEEGLTTMCKLMEEYGDRREAKGILLAGTRFVLNLWNSGMRDPQQIANLTNLSLDEVKKLLEEDNGITTDPRL